MTVREFGVFDSDIVLTADVHLEGEGGRSDVFIELLRRYAALPVVVIGDLFSYWYERWGKVPPRFAGVIDRISSLERKAPVFLVPGNRDLLVGGILEKRSRGALRVAPEVVRLEERGVVITHGDMLTRYDSHYRMYRFVLSSGLMSMLARMVPEAAAEWVAFRLKRMSAAEKRRRGEKLMPLELAEAAKLFSGEARSLICGHFHPDFLVSYVGAGRSVRVLPAWESAPGSHAVLTPEGAFSYNAGL